jgi:hypothetical protein
LGQDLLAGDALHVVNLAGVVLHALHELLLVVSFEHPTAFTFDSFLHLSPWACRAGVSIFAGGVWGMFGSD